ncbi:MAG: NifU family protein [candidate division WOR-3 bacterium]
MDETLAARVQQILDEKVRPMLQMDGGDVELVEITPEGVARVRLTGGCSGCPLAGLTLAMSVERTLVRLIPEIKRIEPVETETARKSASEPGGDTPPGS